MLAFSEQAKLAVSACPTQGARKGEFFAKQKRGETLILWFTPMA
jgi:hypothetical protein